MFNPLFLKRICSLPSCRKSRNVQKIQTFQKMRFGKRKSMVWIPWVPPESGSRRFAPISFREKKYNFKKYDRDYFPPEGRRAMLVIFSQRIQW